MKSISVHINRYTSITYTAVACVLIFICILTGSCKITQPYQQPYGITPATLYRDTTSNDTLTIANIPWKRLFTDTILQNMVNEALQNNLDIKIAESRMKIAAANYRQSTAAFFPSLSANLSTTQQHFSGSQAGKPEIYQAYGAASSWEIDVWGKLASSKRAAKNALLESEAYRRAVQTQLITQIATLYFTLQGYDEQLKITNQTIANRIEDVSTMKTLKESDVVTGADVVQSQANQYAAQVTIPDIKQNIRETENTISYLLGRTPGPIKRDSLLNEKLDIELHTGLPVQLLANRPDVQEAEYQLRYYTELTNVARAYFYPSLTITGEAGLYNNNLAQLFNAGSFFANIIGGLTQPIFNNGLNRQRLAVAKANQEQYFYTFKQVLLTAGQEVSNALYNYQNATDKIEIRTQQIIQLEKAVSYTKELLKYTANTNYVDVLTSEQSLLAARLNAVNDHLQQLESVVNLYQSLGGGWKQ